MKLLHKLTCIFFVVFNALLLQIAQAKSEIIDTAVLFYKNASKGYIKVSTKDSCDFIRVIFPNDSSGKGFIIHDYYKSGKIKLSGKTTPRYVTGTGAIAFDGDCINYFENGVRQSVGHYDDGLKKGNEYFFYPNGKLYAVLKNAPVDQDYSSSINWECYDTTGTKICSEGKGEWITYNKDFKNVSLEGPVKKGLMDGEWHGSTILYSDTIRYIYQYKNGVFQFASATDKTGREYSFSSEIAPAYYSSGPFNFLKEIQSNLKLPKDAQGNKVSVDNVFVAFIVEKDGRISNLETLTAVDAELKNAIVTAFSKCGVWTPRKNYGIPVRAKITVSLKYAIKASGNIYHGEIFYNEQQIGN